MYSAVVDRLDINEVFQPWISASNLPLTLKFRNFQETGLQYPLSVLILCHSSNDRF